MMYRCWVMKIHRRCRPGADGAGQRELARQFRADVAGRIERAGFDLVPPLVALHPRVVLMRKRPPPACSVFVP